MNKHPILFSDEMVRALEAGTKTQTRRVMRPQPSDPDVSEITEEPALDPILKCAVSGHSGHWQDGHGLDLRWKCPYGVPGDLLWVRETFALIECGEKTGKAFRADGFPIDRDRERWTPSIFMRPHQSRFTLKVTDIRVQRLKEINEGDAKAEGIEPIVNFREQTASYHPHLAAYGELWDRLNAKRGFGWSINPWVWVVGFKVL